MLFFDILKMIFPLLVITALLGGALWFVKKYTARSKYAGSKEFSVKVINTQMIFPKRFISLVKVKDKLLVLGITDHSINLLKEFDFTEELDEDFGTTDNPGFLEILKRNIKLR